LLTGALTAISQIPGEKGAASNLRSKWISTRQGAVQLDTLSVIPHTVHIPGFSDSAYTVDYINARVQWKQQPALDSVLIRYRVFPSRLNAPVRRMVFDSVMNNFLGQPYIP